MLQEGPQGWRQFVNLPPSTPLAALGRQSQVEAFTTSQTLAVATGRNNQIGSIPPGQGVVLSLIELKNGELISGDEDGSLRRVSLPAVAKAACSGLDLANDPDTLKSAAGRAALDTCKKLGTSYLQPVK